MEEIRIELVRGAINLAVTLTGLGLGWFIGQRLAYYWNVRQRRRELDLAAAHDFQGLYGEFFSVWKLWNGIAPGRGSPDPELRATCLRRAADAEGMLERLLVKLVTERQLSADDRCALGAFRQGYQRLRHAIQTSTRLAWSASDHPEYLAFKQLAVRVAAIVNREAGRGAVPPGTAFTALREVTSNQHETTWTEA